MSRHIPAQRLVVLLASILMLTVGANAQTTWHVDDDAPNDPGPGDPTVSDPLEDGSPEHPFDAIQEGINAAVDGDTVLVLAGTYTGDGNRDLDFGGKPITVRSANGPETCVIDCEGDPNDPHRGFYFHSGEGSESFIEGLTITNGYVDSGSPGGDDGGGVYCSGSSPTLTNCTFSGNEAQDGGGGILCRSDSNATITDCTFSENSAERGGGVYCYHSGPTLANCTISGNSAISGAGVYCSSSTSTITNCMISANAATAHGGGIYGRYGSAATIAACTISENTADWGGGGVSCRDSGATLVNCAITGNGSARSGGGVECYDSSSVDIRNCTLARNRARSGGGLACDDASAATISNSVVWGNSAETGAEVALEDNSHLTIVYSDARDDQGALYLGSDCTLDWGEGNIVADPRSVRDGIHLQADSPCRDSGDPDGDYSGQIDIDGESRVLNGRVEMGVDEWLDTDDDGLPDFWEQLYFGGPTAGEPLADDDGDGLINLDEYATGRDPFRQPAVFYVDSSGNDDWDGLAPVWDGEHGPKRTIQAAIDAATRYEGDEVVVADGTYTGVGNRDLDFGGRLITLRSESGPVTCIIDCGGSASDHHRAFGFFGGETAEAVVEGFTITNGVVESRGGAIRCGGGTGPTILNCVITGNVADHRGGGIYCDDASNPVLINCTIHGNSVEYRGAGVSCDNGSSPTMLNCVITGNVADHRGGGIYCDHNSNPKLVNSVVSGNTAATRGSGISCSASNATIINCTVSANTGGGDGIFLSSDSSPTITNSIIWGNTSLEIGVSSGDPVITFSDVGGGWPGEGNIDADPLFVDPNGPDGDPNTWEDNDYRLGPGSPCIDAADNEAVPADQFDLDGDSDTTEPLPYDLDGNPRFVDDPDTDDTGNGTPPIVDMGAYEFQVGIVAYLDIKPGSCPNPLNRKSHGKLPVAIAGTAEFDVTQIDVDTLVLARADGVGGSVTPLIGPPGPGIHVEDVATPFEGEPCDCHELECDGIDDLSMKFETELVVAELQLDDFTGGTFVELVLSGELSDGTPFSATDCIRLVPPGSGSANVAAGPEGGDGGLDARPGSQPPNSEEGHPTGGASGQDADRAPGDADANEESQDTFAVPLAACGALSPALSLATIVGVCVLRPRRP